MSEAAISTALAAHFAAVFTVNPIVESPENHATLEPGQSRLYAGDYELEELDFRQDRITYPFVFLYIAPNVSTPETDRASLYTNLESVRTLIRADETLGGAAWDTRVSNLLVQDTTPMVASMEILARVLN